MRGQRYLADKPCKNSHDPCERYVSSGECVKCRDGQRTRRKEAWGDADAEYLRDNAEVYNANQRNKYRSDERTRVKKILNGARTRAYRDGVPFNLTVDDVLPVPRICPALGIAMSVEGPRSITPTLDRIVPSSGYVPGNVRWISHRANRLKSDATLQELEKLVSYVKESANG